MNLSRRKLPSLNALRAFEVSGRRLSFRAAAEELGVTQGAVAQQVRQLERHLGLTLFRRLSRGLALTPAGTDYLASVTRAFDLLVHATATLIVRPEVITISVTPTFAAKLLIPNLVDLNATLPGVDLRTVATEAVSDFDRDQVDIAVRLFEPPPAYNHEARLLFRHELVAVASPYLVVGLRLPLTCAQIRKLPLLHDAHGRWPEFLQTEEKLPGPVFNQTTLALDTALAGQGVALACRAFVEADLAAGRLVQVMNASLTVAPDYFLVRRRSTPIGEAAEAAWQWCIQRFTLIDE